MRVRIFKSLVQISAVGILSACAATVADGNGMAMLQDGNKRFVQERLAHPHSDAARREVVSTGQSPHSIILSCSDSRVPPELVFDQGLGDVFVIRTAGQVVDATVLASIEFGIAELKAKNLVVMGHTSCGAVKAALSSEGGDAGSESLTQLVGSVKANIAPLATSEAGVSFERAVSKQAVSTLQQIIERSSIVRDAHQRGSLEVHAAVYHLEDGRVEFLPLPKRALLTSAELTAAQ